MQVRFWIWGIGLQDLWCRVWVLGSKFRGLINYGFRCSSLGFVRLGLAKRSVVVIPRSILHTPMHSPLTLKSPQEEDTLPFTGKCGISLNLL